MPADRVGLLMACCNVCTSLVADTLELATVQSFQAKTQTNLSTVPLTDQGPVTALVGIAPRVPWASILGYVRKTMPTGLTWQLHRCYF